MRNCRLFDRPEWSYFIPAEWQVSMRTMPVEMMARSKTCPQDPGLSSKIQHIPRTDDAHNSSQQQGPIIPTEREHHSAATHQRRA